MLISDRKYWKMELTPPRDSSRGSHHSDEIEFVAIYVDIYIYIEPYIYICMSIVIST